MFLVSRPSKRFSTSSLSTKRDEIVRQAGFLLGQRQETSSVRRLLIHVESQRDVLILGEEEDQEVVTGLALLDGRIQADLVRTVDNAVETQTTKQYRTLVTSTY